MNIFLTILGVYLIITMTTFLYEELGQQRTHRKFPWYYNLVFHVTFPFLIAFIFAYDWYQDWRKKK